MDEIATLPTDARRTLFVEASLARGIPTELVEKDFWVCWILRRVFAREPSASAAGQSTPSSILFKGGTSLSKVFGAITRFSEDVDLSLDRRELGFDGVRDPSRITSSKRRAAAVESLATACRAAVIGPLRDRLRTSIASALGTDAGWSLTAADEDALPLHEQGESTLHFAYPRDRSDAGPVLPFVRLEFGARSDHWPTAEGSVTPIAAEVFPDAFRAAQTRVRVLAAERTFWEKATILHRWHHAERRIPARLTRHYYDLFELSRSPIGASALAQPDLLTAVAEHKSRLFPQAWARYELARAGSLRLMPPARQLPDLRADYEETKDLIYGSAPRFDDILAQLASLETDINAG
jgi:hypothetical protein